MIFEIFFSFITGLVAGIWLMQPGRPKAWWSPLPYNSRMYETDGHVPGVGSKEPCEFCGRETPLRKNGQEVCGDCFDYIP